MLLSIKSDKNHKLVYHFVHDAEELIRELGLKITKRALQALRKSLDSETEVVETLVTQAYPNNPCFVEYDEADTGIRVVVFEQVVPKVLQAMDGGLVQWTLADMPVEVLRLDLDVDGADPKELVKWTDIDKKKSKAYACIDSAEELEDELGFIKPEFVERVYNEVRPQLDAYKKS